MLIIDKHVAAGLEMPPTARRAFYAAIVEYMALGEEPQGLPREARAAWVLVKEELDYARAKAEAGRRGGDKKQQNRSADAEEAPSRTSSKTGSKPSSKQPSKPSSKTGSNDGGTTPSNMPSKPPSQEQEQEQDIKPLEKALSGERAQKRPPFAPPTREMVSEYASEARLDVDADAFCDFYDAKGWRVGASPMRDWKAAVRNWARREPAFQRGVSCDADPGLVILEPEGLPAL